MNRPLNILIIDDEASFSSLLKIDLESDKDYIVHTANSGEEGIESIKSGQFDVILLDYHLGTMTGLQVLHWMSEQKMETPVIMLTTESGEELKMEGMNLGVKAWIVKPFKMEMLLSAVEKLII